MTVKQRILDLPKKKQLLFSCCSADPSSEDLLMDSLTKSLKKLSAQVEGKMWEEIDASSVETGSSVAAETGDNSMETGDIPPPATPES